MRRVLVISLAVVAGFTLLLVLGVAAALYSQSVTRWVMGAVTERVDGLAVAQVQGRLGSEVTLRGVQYDAEGLSVAADSVNLRWLPAGLWDSTLLIESLSAQGLSIDVAGAGEQDDPASETVLPTSLGLPISVELKEARVRVLHVATPTVVVSAGQATLTGHLGAGHEEAEHAVSLDWQDLVVASASEPQAQTPLLRSTQGQWAVRGRLEQYETSLNAAQQVRSAPPAEIRLTGRGDSHSIRFDTIEAGALGGSLSAVATVGWSPALTFDVKLSGESIDPGLWDARWPGDLALSLDASGSGASVAVRELQVDGVLREQPLRAQAALDYEDGTATVHALNGTLAGSEVNFSGRVGDRFDAQWRVNSPDLGAFHPEFSGSMRSAGKLRGTLESPLLKGKLDIASLAVGEARIASLSADIDLDLAAESGLSPSTVVARDVQWGQWRVAQVDAVLDGNRADHTLKIVAEADQFSVNATARGALYEDNWQGELVRARVQPGQLAAWQLAAPQSVSVSASEQTVERGCWRNGEAELCLVASLAEQASTAQVQLTTLALNTFSAFLPESLLVEGTVDGEATFTQDAGEPWSMNAKLATSAGELGQRATREEEAQTVVFAPGVVSLRGGLDRMDVDVDLPFAERGGVSGELQVENLGDAGGGELSGALDVSLPALGFVAAMSPELEHLRGSATLRLKLDGTLAAPQPTGSLSVRATDIALLTPGLYLDDLAFNARVDASGSVTLDAVANAEGGTLALDGTAQMQMPDDDSQWPVHRLQARLTGERFPFWRSSEASVWGSPDLKLGWNGERLRLEGRVHVPRASITPTELPPSAVRVSSDQVIVREDQTANGVTDSATGSVMDHFYASVALTLGDDVAIDGFGFTGKLAGQLSIAQKPGKPVLASGELNVVDGEYRAFGQGLVIERGQMLFAGGSIDNPGLNIRAQRRPAAGVVVGVNVTGPLQQPSVDVFSEPLMSSSNQLSWLVLGRPFETTDGAEADYINQVALLVGIRGGDYLAKEIGDKIGVDTIGIETGSGEAGAASDVNQAALVVGKYLTPRLYVSYGVGLLESISTVKLRYRISERWNLETESSPIASGGDVNFSIER